MFTDYFKKTALIFCILPLASCGLFSSDKELPKGERVAILATKESPKAIIKKQQELKLSFAWQNESWNQTGGNAKHLSGNLLASSNPKPLWKASAGKGSSKRNILISSPVIAKNSVFAQDAEGTVSAFDLKTGKKIFKHKIKPTIKNENDTSIKGSGLAVNEKNVFATTGFGSVIALDIKTGNELWRQETSTPLRTAPTLCGNKVIVQTMDNQLFAYNTHTGNELWRYKVPTEETILTGGAAPACDMDKNLLIAGFSNGEIEAFNSNIGYPLWSATILNQQNLNASSGINAIKAAPVMDHELIYALGNNDNLSAIDFRTGEKIWQHQTGGMNMPWISGNYLFMITNAKTLLGLSKVDGQVLWSVPLLEEYDIKEKNDITLFGPVVINGNLFVTASNGMLYIYSPENGELQSKKEISKGLASAPIIADQTIVFFTKDADLIAYK